MTASPTCLQVFPNASTGSHFHDLLISILRYEPLSFLPINPVTAYPDMLVGCVLANMGTDLTMRERV